MIPGPLASRTTATAGAVARRAPEQEMPVTTAGAVARAKATAVPASETLPWLISAVLVGLALYYVVGIDQGAVSVFGDTTVLHELVHDARHFLGFPCH